MSNKLKNGSNCAACVLYPESDTHSWILTKVEKKLPGNRFLVRDEFADDPRYETYQVDSNHITPFPSPPSEEYKPGETILALWHDDERNEWSTMFYNAEVKSVEPKFVRLLYSQTDFEVEVEKNKLAKFPPKFKELAEEVDDNETSQNQTGSTTAQNTEDVTEDAKTEDGKDNSTTQAVDEDSGRSDQVSEDKGNSKPISEDESTVIKAETDHLTEKFVKEENRSEEETRPHPVRHGRGGHSHAPKVAAPKPPLDTAEARRVHFMFHKAEVTEAPKPKYLSDEDFSKLSGAPVEFARMNTKAGTPLLDSLNDPELFDQEEMLHVTGSGIISVANVDECKKSGLAEGKMPCGKLGRIINEWIKNPMD